MYKIGEFSKIVSITVKALRYYDEIGILSPSYIDSDNGYRYYDEGCYYKALRIRTLKKYGFTIKEIQDVLPNIIEDKDLGDYLIEKSNQLEHQILSIKKIQQQISIEVNQLEEVKSMSVNQKIEVVNVEKMKVASIRYKGKYEDVGIYLGKLYKVVGMKGVGKPFSMYYDEEFTEENADIEVCVEVENTINKGEVITKELESIKCVSLTHVGSYDTLSSSYKAIADYIRENNLESYTPSREIYLKGPGMIFKGNPDKYETRILMPVKY